MKAVTYIGSECHDARCGRRHVFAARCIATLESVRYVVVSSFRLREEWYKGTSGSELVAVSLFNHQTLDWKELMTVDAGDLLSAYAFVVGHHSLVELTQAEFQLLSKAGDNGGYYTSLP